MAATWTEAGDESTSWETWSTAVETDEANWTSAKTQSLLLRTQLLILRAQGGLQEPFEDEDGSEDF